MNTKRSYIYIEDNLPISVQEINRLRSLNLWNSENSLLMKYIQLSKTWTQLFVINLIP